MALQYGDHIWLIKMAVEGNEHRHALTSGSSMLNPNSEETD
jgi:hypothetical protein